MKIGRRRVASSPRRPCRASEPTALAKAGDNEKCVRRFASKLCPGSDNAHHNCDWMSFPSEWCSFMNVTEFIAKERKTVQVSMGALLLVLIGIGDYFASSSFLEFSVFFIIPVAFFTGIINRKAGIAVSSASAAIILWANVASPPHIAHPGIAYWNALIWLGFLIAITFIIAELKALHVRERQLSRQDSLTSINNRLAFYEFATVEMNRAQRYSQPITLAYVDLDGFKEINDSFGHDTGDAVLVTVAQTMQVSIRQTDMAARMGGDEFALILPNTDEGTSTMVLNKLLKRLEGGRAAGR
jgi:GGDEF domain-containing protein